MRKSVLIGGSGVIIIIALVVVGAILIFNQRVEPEINETIIEPVINYTSRIFYRFEDNKCSAISIRVYQKTSNDYLTLSECKTKIIIPVERVPTVGDFYKFDELKIGENLSSVKSYLDENDMPNFLMDFYLEDNGGDEYDYNQNILLGGDKINLTTFRDSDYEGLVGLNQPTNITGFKIPSNTFILNYTIIYYYKIK